MGNFIEKIAIRVALIIIAMFYLMVGVLYCTALIVQIMLFPVFHPKKYFKMVAE